MKLFNIMQKNYKVLFRSRASAAVVVLGPLLIILLVKKLKKQMERKAKNDGY